MLEVEMHLRNERALAFKVAPSYGAGRQQCLHRPQSCPCPRCFIIWCTASTAAEEDIDDSPRAFLGTALFLMS